MTTAVMVVLSPTVQEAGEAVARIDKTRDSGAGSDVLVLLRLVVSPLLPASLATFASCLHPTQTPTIKIGSKNN